MDVDVEPNQKAHDILAVFWLRRLSPYLTRLLLRTRVTPNQVTVSWGIIGALNSIAIYGSLTGRYWLVPAAAFTYVACDLLDCVDGELARCRRIANPIGGKLLDGVCHRAIEYSLLAAFAGAAYTRTHSVLVLPVAILLLTADAMYTYVYERRLTSLRVHAGETGRMKLDVSRIYEHGTRWADLTRQQQVRTFVGQIHHKSIYPVIAIGLVSGEALLVCLGALGVYKHWKWVRLIRRTLAGFTSQAPVSPLASSLRLPRSIDI